MPSPSSKEFNPEQLLGYLSIFQKHARLMILLFAMSLLGGLVFYTYARSVYQAQSLVRVQRLERPMEAGGVGQGSVFVDGSDQALIREFTSDNIIIRTAARLGFKGSRTQIEASQLKKLNVGFNSEGDLIVEVFPYSLRWAQLWTSTMVEEYLRYREEKREEQRTQIISSFTRELTQIEAQMDAAFTRKYELREAVAVANVAMDLERLVNVPKELVLIERRLAAMEQARLALTNPRFDTVTKLAMAAFTEERTPNPIFPLTVGKSVTTPSSGGASAELETPTVVLPSNLMPLTQPWEELEREQRRLQSQLRLLEGTYGSEHPKMAAIRKQLEGVGRALDLELEGATRRFNLQLASLQDRKAELEKKLPEFREASRRVDKSNQEMTRAEAGQVAWAGIYDRMTKQISALNFWADKERVNLQFMGHLDLKEFPVSPHRMKTMLAAIFFGLGLALTVPVLFGYLDSSVSNPTKIEDQLQLQLLGMISDWRVEDPEDVDQADLKRQRAELLEQFRGIRTSLMLRAGTDNAMQVVLVVSAVPGEGKTTVSLNVARSFAQKGDRTLLIDGDLYRGSLHRQLGAPGRPGLSGFLAEETTMEGLCVSVGPNLDLLPVGKRLRTGTDLVDSKRFGDLITALRQRYQRIIIDSPPVLGLAEVPLLQQHSDAAILVIASDMTPIEAVRDALTVLRRTKDHVAGFVLNRVNFNSVQYRYRYYYYSSTYYSKYARLDAAPEAEA